MDFSKFSAKEIYNLARTRHRYGSPDRIETYLDNAWFVEIVFKNITGRRPNWGWGREIPKEDEKAADESKAITQEFCLLSDCEVEKLLVSKSTLDAANYSIKIKNRRLEPEAERELLERCKGKKSRLNALLSYCGKWDIMPENMTEITMVAGFEGGRRGRIGADFMKKLAENKRKCKDLLAQIMNLEGISEDEPIKKIMERLG